LHAQKGVIKSCKEKLQLAVRSSILCLFTYRLMRLTWSATK